MAITRRTIIDKIEILEDGQIQLRDATLIEEDGVEIAPRQFHRRTLAPGADISREQARSQAVCGAVWTPDVVTAYEEGQKQIHERLERERERRSVTPPLRSENRT